MANIKYSGYGENVRNTVVKASIQIYLSKLEIVHYIEIRNIGKEITQERHVGTSQTMEILLPHLL